MATLSKITINSLAANTVSANNIANSSITGVKLSDFTVTGDKIADVTITTDKIVDTTITGNKYGLNSISANTIDPQSSFSFKNVTISTTSTFMGSIVEKANVFSTGGLPSVVDIPTSGSGVLYYTAPAVANAVINFTGLGSVASGNIASYVLMFQNGAGTAKYITGVQVDGVSTSIHWNGGVVSRGSSSNTEIYSFNILKTDDTPTYNVFVTYSSYTKV